jgi:hypothetical protein
MLEYVDFDTGERIRPSVSTLADRAGVSVRTVRGALRVLEDTGVLTAVRRSRGGASKSGRGYPSEYRMDLELMETLNPAHAAGLVGDTAGTNPAIGAGLVGVTATTNPPPSVVEPGTECAPTRQSATANPAPAADNSLSDSPSESPNDSTTTTRGGGGGGVDLESGEEDKAGGEAQTPPTAMDLLTKFGVSRGKARTLADRFDGATVEAGIAWVRARASDNVASPPGLLVSILEDGTAEIERDRRKEEGQRMEEDKRRQAELAAAEELQRRRIDALNTTFARVKSGLEDEGQRAKFQRAMEYMVAEWPNTGALAAAGIVPDEVLFDPATKPNAVFNLVREAARAQSTCSNGTGKVHSA